MTRFSSWPAWALTLLRNLLEWSGVLPMMLIEVYVEMARREVLRTDESGSLGVWCPAAVGVA